MATYRTCRTCHQKIDIDHQTGWINPRKYCYYHISCFENFEKKKTDVHAVADNDMWFAAMWDYLRHDLKMCPNYNKVKAQWDKFLKDSMTAKGIYFTLRYFYDVKNGDKEKSQEGIGIIPYIYKDGTQYWADRENREAGICARIEAQIRDFSKRQTVKIQQTVKPKPQNNGADLAAIEFEEDDG